MTKPDEVKRKYGNGTIVYKKTGKFHYSAKVKIGTKIDSKGKTQIIYTQIGRFETIEQANNYMCIQVLLNAV